MAFLGAAETFPEKVLGTESLSDITLPDPKARKVVAKPWGRDPFGIPSQGINTGEVRPTTPNRAQRGAFTLSAIITRRGEGMAVINHEILRKGDLISGMRVAEIRKDRVILKDTTGVLDLMLTPFTVGAGEPIAR